MTALCDEKLAVCCLWAEECLRATTGRTGRKYAGQQAVFGLATCIRVPEVYFDSTAERFSGFRLSVTQPPDADIPCMGRTELTNSYQTSRGVCKHSANKYFIGFTTAISDVRQASHCLCDKCLHTCLHTCRGRQQWAVSSRASRGRTWWKQLTCICLNLQNNGVKNGATIGLHVVDSMSQNGHLQHACQRSNMLVPTISNQIHSDPHFL